MGKSLRVDHCENYKPPKDNEKMDDETRLLHTEGCAPKPQLNADQIKREEIKTEVVDGIRLPPRLPIACPKVEIDKLKKVTSSMHSPNCLIGDFLCKYIMRVFRFFFCRKRRKKNTKK